MSDFAFQVPDELVEMVAPLGADHRRRRMTRAC
jgi:hypothetical protein